MVRAYRRISTVNGIEVHQTPPRSEVADIERGWPMIVDVEELPQLGPEQPVFIARDANGKTAAILIGGMDGHSAYIYQVESFQRGSGYGTKIVRAFEKWAKRRGATHIDVNSASFSYGFWKKIGYEPVVPVIEEVQDGVLFSKYDVMMVKTL